MSKGWRIAQMFAPAVGVTIGLILTWTLTFACKPAPPAPIAPEPIIIPPDDSTPITDPCDYVEGRTRDQIATACVTRDESGQMAMFVLAHRDGGTEPSLCTPLPFTSVCTAGQEAVDAINFITAQRTEMLQRAPSRKTRP